MLRREAYRYLAPMKLVYYPLLLGGVPIFALTGRTPHLSHISMRRLFCMTNGHSNALVSRLLEQPAPAPGNSTGVLGMLDPPALAGIVRELDEHGYYKFDARLPADICASLERQSLVAPAKARDSVRRDYSEATITSLPEVHELLADETLLAVATAYLRCLPVNDLVAMWWSYVGDAPSSLAAQLYHFDMDRLRFLKFFFYLTDVDTDTGPHCYIDGSHRDKPARLRRDGRKSDDEIASHYAYDRRKEIVGPRGTIVAADTSGFHKGKPLVRGSRLMLQIEFANSLFGTRFATVPLHAPSPRVSDFITTHRSVFKRFRL